ncbi:LysR family transcriptional regulator [Fodinicola feengrottensis]|uniref:LysR family transcriptional regulator n=1 Tax=Fodinicola feengrottensis TaxID=435914 RepID=A0ABP4S1Y1_9ACTN
MEFRELETFLVLAQELHFGRSATRLHVSQARVSQLIRDLERELGGPLFDRTSRRVTLTALGERFRQTVQQPYEQLLLAVRDTRAASREVAAELRVGYMQSIGGSLASELIAPFERAYPHCRTTVVALPMRHAMVPRADLDDGTAEVVLCWSPGGSGDALTEPGLSVGPVLIRLPRGVLVREDHPFANRSTIDVEELADYEIVDPSRPAGKYVEAWVPRTTPAGRPIHRTEQDLPGLLGRTEPVLEDIFTIVTRTKALHVTFVGLLDRYPRPDMRVVEVNGLAPMVLLPMWRTAHENTTIRAFVEEISAHR